MSEPIIVTVAKDLEDLVPTFMKNRGKELETLRTALAAGDFEQLRQIGHRMKGVGNSYGFEKVSLLGQQIEDRRQGGRPRRARGEHRRIRRLPGARPDRL